MELIIAIATLCQVPGDSVNTVAVDRHQLKCQKYYVQCVEQRGETYKAVKQCIKEREIK